MSHQRRDAVPGTTRIAAIIAIGIGIAGLAAAQQQPEPAANEAPASVSAADLLQSARAEVRIIARENHEVEEYRVGNNVYLIKVKPKHAPPYYLIDQDGSGDLEWKRGSDLERTSVPHWAVFRW